MPKIVVEGVDLAYMQEFIREVLVICVNDKDGITFGLDELALNAGVILGLSKLEMQRIMDEG